MPKSSRYVHVCCQAWPRNDKQHADEVTSLFLDFKIGLTFLCLHMDELRGRLDLEVS